MSAAAPKIILEDEEAYQKKLKKEYPALNNRTKYALLDFIKMQFPSIIDTFVLNDTVEQSFASDSDIKMKGDVYNSSYEKLLRKYRDSLGNTVYINFYFVRYLNSILSEKTSFRESFDEALMSGHMASIRKKELQVESLLDAIAMKDAQVNRVPVDTFPTKMREEWRQMHTQIRAKLEAIRLEYSRYHIQIHNAEERRRETSERNASAHAQAAEVSGRGKGKGRATRSRA